MQSETGFPSSHQLKSYVASKSRLKLAARCPVSGCWPSCTIACRTQLFVLANDFNIYQRLLLIFVAVSVDFFQQCFILFVQLVTFKGVVFNLASPGVS